MYIIISKECEDCGGLIAIKQFKKEPTKEEIKEVEDSLGGMYCIRTHVICLEGSDIITIERPD